MKTFTKNLLIKAHLYSPAKSIYQNYKKGVEHRRYLNSNEYKELQNRKKFYSTFLNKDSLVFDVGANIGNRTEAFLDLGMKVVAIEPQSDCINVLKSKFSENPNFNIFEGGMDSEKGSRVIHIANADTISSMSEEWISKVKEGTFRDYTWGREEKVEVDTLDNLIKKYGSPDFIKVDVEGFEINVLKGLTQKVKYISFEFMFPEFLDKAIECIEYLNSIGEIECNFSWGESMEFVNSEWKSSNDFIENIKEAAKTKSEFGDIYVRFKL